jgi:hypothetical protein
MTDFWEIPALSASDVEFFSLMLSANYLLIDKLNSLIVDIADLKTSIESVNTSIDKGSNAASLLSAEYYSKQDLDNDGLVYGIHFYITNCPPMLTTIPARGTPLTWDQYIDSHPDLF